MYMYRDDPHTIGGRLAPCGSCRNTKYKILQKYLKLCRVFLKKRSGAGEWDLYYIQHIYYARRHLATHSYMDAGPAGGRSLAPFGRLLQTYRFSRSPSTAVSLSLSLCSLYSCMCVYTRLLFSFQTRLRL